MKIWLPVSFLFLTTCAFQTKPKLVVGSKTFTEGYLLSEIVAEVLEQTGEVVVERRMGLGATGIIYESLRTGQIDLYPEYTGTIAEAILKDPSLQTIAQINQALAATGLHCGQSLGFNDTYALAMSRALAKQKAIRTISDLKTHPEIRAGFTHEFLKRSDGFDGLTRHYGLNLKNYSAFEHSLAYESLAQGKIDLVEVYSTDAKIQKYDLQLLQDDKDYFPKYLAVILGRKEFDEKFPRSAAALKSLEGRISEAKMSELNAKVELEGWSFEKTAHFFLQDKFQAAGEPTSMSSSIAWDTFVRRTKEHLQLVFTSLIFAILISVPLGMMAARRPRLAQVILAFTGLLQTIPSLALLCFLIPIFGIGYVPAVVALFLYALLPIVRNTYLGFSTIDSRLIESAEVLGLSKWDQLRLVEFPLASPAILAGIKLSAVINVGTATLAAFIGAGGYGAIIVTGLALNDTKLILQGAIPSALLALLVHGIFELLDRKLIPEGLKVS
jgi:osmoprotectant transport system permease protein